MMNIPSNAEATSFSFVSLTIFWINNKRQTTATTTATTATTTTSSTTTTTTTATTTTTTIAYRYLCLQLVDLVVEHCY